MYKNWYSVYDFFEALNKSKCKYVVMRNYEEMHLKNFFCNGHEDIDIMCDDIEEFENITKVINKFDYNDHIHFWIYILDQRIPIDVRNIYDNYYCENWTKDIINYRIKANNGNWYVMDDLNYYYSLVYHSILQKENFSNEYLIKLNKMASQFNLDNGSKETHIKNLIYYMKNRKYWFSFPNDPSIPFQIENLPILMFKNKKYFIKIVSKIKIERMRCFLDLKGKVVNIINFFLKGTKR